MRFVNIGYGNLVSADRIIAVVSNDSAPVKRIMSFAKENGTLIDATQGRKTHSVIITDSNQIITSYLTCEAIQNRVEDKNE
ncbi:MAG: DUF370 domain-containing protein [Acutalibacteraceae bacterium]|nr:DUF370 domain-containing protein [Acutalibacteraceae bacterium]